MDGAQISKEAARLAEVERYEFLYEHRQDELQHLCDLTRRVLNGHFVCMLLVGKDHVQFISNIGANHSVRPRSESLADSVIDQDDLLEFENLEANPRIK